MSASVNYVQLTRMSNQLVARTAYIFGPGSPEEDRMRVTVNRSLRALLGSDRKAAAAALADLMTLVDEFDLHGALADHLGEPGPS